MLREKIDKLIGESRLNKEPKKILVYQAIKNEFLRFTTAKNAKPLDDAAEINILRKMIKERKDAAVMFIEGNRQDLSDENNFEISILEEFVPKAPSEEDMRAAIEDFISTLDGTFDRKQMGNCIKFVKGKIPTVDGASLSKLVQTYF